MAISGWSSTATTTASAAAAASAANCILPLVNCHRWWLQKLATTAHFLDIRKMMLGFCCRCSDILPMPVSDKTIGTTALGTSQFITKVSLLANYIEV